MDQKSYQMGGVVLILAALTGIVGNVLHGPQPATLDAYAALGTGWMVSHVAIAMTGTLYVIASLFLARHFAGTAGNGHALVATGLVIVGGIAVFAIGALETSGFSTVLRRGHWCRGPTCVSGHIRGHGVHGCIGGIPLPGGHRGLRRGNDERQRLAGGGSPGLGWCSAWWR